MANRSHVRKQGVLDVDEDERTDYYNQPLEQSAIDDDSPFRDPSEETPKEPVDSTEELRAPRAEVPLEDLLTAPKRKEEKISGGYEIVSSPRSRVYTIEADPAMSIISSGGESWECIENEDDEEDDGMVVTDHDLDPKPYSEVVKNSSGEGGQRNDTP